MSSMNHANLFLAMAISLSILLGFHYFYERPRLEAYRAAIAQQKAAKLALKEPPASRRPAPSVSTAAASTELKDRALLVAEQKRVAVESGELSGSINLAGGRIDDLVLRRYRETVDPASPPVVLLSPSGSARPHPACYAEFGWLGENVKLPSSDTEWSLPPGARLTPESPVTLTWDNGEGLRFERVITLDDHFMFTITDRVRNSGERPVTLHPFGLLVHQTIPDQSELAMGHIGPLGVLGGVLKEHSYGELEDKVSIAEASQGGWAGITSKYWHTALIPPPEEQIAASFKFARRPEQKTEDGKFQVDYRGAPATIAPGATHEYTRHFFAGAKRVELLDMYAEKYNIEKFALAIDFGWFGFLTKPLLYTLNWLGRQLGNVGLAILALTVLVKMAVLPLGIKSYRSMAKMKKLQPELKLLSERFKDDKPRQSIEMMELYKREKVSPLSGCLPIFAQLPVFFALYKVLYIGIDMRHAPFFGWIKDLSAPDPTTILNLFGLMPWNIPASPAFLHIGVWPLLMGVSMYALQRMNPAPPDPMQAQVMMLMPVIFTAMLGPSMAAGLLIYWTWSNTISITQQFLIYRQMDKKHSKP
ncbi:MAG: membrane protein insertase YidC [Alphaproteobacteria bacterium]